jgi:hypothetical protein
MKLTVRTNASAPEGWRDLTGTVESTCVVKGVRYVTVRIPKLNGTWRFAGSEVDPVEEGT